MYAQEILNKSLNAIKKKFTKPHYIVKLVKDLNEKCDEDSLMYVQIEIEYLKMDIEYCEKNINDLLIMINRNRVEDDGTAAGQSIMVAIKHLQKMKKESEKHLQILKRVEYNFSENLSEKILEDFYTVEKEQSTPEIKTKPKTVGFLITSIIGYLVILLFFPSLFYFLNYIKLGTFQYIPTFPGETLPVFVFMQTVATVIVVINVFSDIKNCIRG